MGDPDVVIIGGGPNGLTAAAILARAGLAVLVLEASATIGGAARTAEVTRPGFRHDLYSAFYPLLPVGPLGQLPLAEHGLVWCDAERPYGGGTPDGPGVTLERTLEGAAAHFERAQPGDGAGWRELERCWDELGAALLALLFNPLGDPAPLLRAVPLLRAPRRLLERAQLVIASARTTAERLFQGEDARVWFIGSALHSDLAPDDAGGALFSLLLSVLGRRVGMPVPRGGAQAIPDALVRLITAHGGRVLTGQRVERVVVRDRRAVAVRTASGEIPARRAVLATATPPSLFLDLVGEGHLPAEFVRLVRRFRWGCGTFKLDCALSGAPLFRAAPLQGTLVLHLAPSVEALVQASAAVRRGALPDHPLLIAGLPTLADPSRAPAGQHTLWIETHVPARIAADAAGRITARSWATAREPFAERLLDEFERYAPGLRALLLAYHAQSPDDLQAGNANLVGGDITGGSCTLDQQLLFRPLAGWFRHRTPIRGLYIGGASTHPGGGVHGGPGANAARVLLGDLRLTRLAERWHAGRDRLETRLRRLLAARP